MAIGHRRATISATMTSIPTARLPLTSTMSSGEAVDRSKSMAAPVRRQDVQVSAREAGFARLGRDAGAQLADRHQHVDHVGGAASHHLVSLRSRSCPVRACRPARPRAARRPPADIRQHSSARRWCWPGWRCRCRRSGCAVDAGHGDQAQLPGRICKPATIWPSSSHPPARPPPRQRRVDAVLPQQRHLARCSDSTAAAGRAVVKAEADAFHAHALDLVRPEIGVGRQADAEDARPTVMSPSPARVRRPS
jgi:hypothetical protein